MVKLPAQPIVDFHVHLFPGRLFEAIWKQFVADYGWSVLHRLYWRKSVAYLRERGVGPIVYSNYAHRPGVAKGLNDWNLAVLAEFTDLYCFAAFHPDDADGLAMAASLLDHPRILGFKLQLLVQRFTPHDERLFPREDEIDTLLGLNLSQAFYDSVFRDNGLRLIGQAGQIRP